MTQQRANSDGITFINMESVLQKLAKEHKVFHSEAEFQFALAWQIKSDYSDATIRLEMPFRIDGQKTRYIDIVVKYKGQQIPIELKYIKHECICEEQKEEYVLTDHSAKDVLSYDFCKDIERVEQYIAAHNDCEKGYCILLTNNCSYTKASVRKSGYKAFQVYEGETKKGELRWGESLAKGTTEGRNNPIKLEGTYEMHWNEYSKVTANKNSQFFYNLVEIRGRL